MADIFAIFGILLFLGIVFPGLLTAVWLLFPNRVRVARVRIEQTPWKCLLLGFVLAVGLTLPTAILLSLPAAPAKLLGWSVLFLGLAFSSLGAAGLARRLGEAFNNQAGGHFTPAGSFLRGAVILELAAAFPIIGWFLVLPISALECTGAACFALLNWSPGVKPAPAIQNAAEAVPSAAHA